jgi:MFS family permease
MLKDYAGALQKIWQSDRQALKYFILAALFEGIVFGTVLMQESVCRLQYNAENYHITLVSLMTGSTCFFAILITMAIKGRHTAFIYLCGLAGRGVLLLTFFADSVWSFLLILFIYYSLSSIRSPLITEITRKLFEKPVQGRIFGIYRIVFLIFSFIAAGASGRLFDMTASSIPVVFSFAGICGIFSFYYMLLLCRKAKMDEISINPLSNKDQILAVFKNRAFFNFEAVFMIYGLAFMLLHPVIPIFLVNSLKFSYSEFSNARGLIEQGILILFTPLAGSLFDKKDFHKLTAWACLILAFFPVCLLISDYFNTNSPGLGATKIFAYSGFVFFGLGLTIIGIVWNLAGLYFSGESDSAPYQAAHVTLVGVRGILAPVAGYLIITFFSCRAAFATAFLLWVTASFLMFRLSPGPIKKNTNKRNINKRNINKKSNYRKHKKEADQRLPLRM